MFRRIFVPIAENPTYSRTGRALEALATMRAVELGAATRCVALDPDYTSPWVSLAVGETPSRFQIIRRGMVARFDRPVSRLLVVDPHAYIGSWAGTVGASLLRRGWVALIAGDDLREVSPPPPPRASVCTLLATDNVAGNLDAAPPGLAFVATGLQGIRVSLYPGGPNPNRAPIAPPADLAAVLRPWILLPLVKQTAVPEVFRDSTATRTADETGYQAAQAASVGLWAPASDLDMTVDQNTLCFDRAVGPGSLAWGIQLVSLAGAGVGSARVVVEGY